MIKIVFILREAGILTLGENKGNKKKDQEGYYNLFWCLTYQIKHKLAAENCGLESCVSLKKFIHFIFLQVFFSFFGNLVHYARDGFGPILIGLELFSGMSYFEATFELVG